MTTFVKLLGAFFALAAIDILIRESGHAAAGILLGLNIKHAGMEWAQLSPFLVWDAGWTWRTALMSYAGGLTAALAFLALYGALYGRFAGSLLWWGIGAIAAMLSAKELANGLIEGFAHQQYLAGGGDLMSWTVQVQYAAVLLGILFHWRLTGATLGGLGRLAYQVVRPSPDHV